MTRFPTAFMALALSVVSYVAPPGGGIADILFFDTVIDLDSDSRDAFLRGLIEYNSHRGLYSFTFDGQGHLWIDRVKELDVRIEENECSGVEIGVIDCGGHYLLGGVAGIREGIYRCLTPDSYLLPEGFRFEIGGCSYELLATAQAEDYDWDNARDVEIWLVDHETGRRQILSRIEKLESTRPRVLFIGDLDGDSRPDILMQEGYNYEYSKKVLYLSSLAAEGEMVARAGVSALWSDC